MVGSSTSQYLNPTNRAQGWRCVCVGIISFLSCSILFFFFSFFFSHRFEHHQSALMEFCRWRGQFSGCRPTQGFPLASWYYLSFLYLLVSLYSYLRSVLYFSLSFSSLEGFPHAGICSRLLFSVAKTIKL